MKHDNAQYKSDVYANGAIARKSIFLNGPSLSAKWSRNKPVANVTYRKSIKHETESISNNVSVNKLSRLLNVHEVCLIILKLVKNIFIFMYSKFHSQLEIISGTT